jgi:opacity protein-like surface antigen
MRRLLPAVIAMCLLAPALARGADQAPPAYAPATPPPGYVPPPPPSPFNTGELFAGLGFGGFSSAPASENVGVAWTLRGGGNFLRYLGAELNYQGLSSTVNSIIVNGVPTGASSFTEQQITANLKVGFPLLVGYPGWAHVLRPYALAGVGGAWVNVASVLGAIGIVSVGAAAFPFGAGISYTPSPSFIIDARFTYNVLTTASADSWNVGFNLGANFGG